MSNLKPKKNTDGTPTSISQISKMLRTKVEEPKEQHRGLEIERRPIMVDTELYDIFAMLKAKKRVPAAGLVSLICRQWVIQNKVELEQMLDQKINVQ